MALISESSSGPAVCTIRFRGTLAGEYQPPITTSTSSVTAVEEIPGGDDGSAANSTDPRGIVSLTDTDLAGETLGTIAAFSTGVPSTDIDQLTAFTYDGDGDQLTQTAVDPAGTPNEITAYDYGVGGTVGTNLFSNDLMAEEQLPDPSTGYASTISPGTSHSGEQLYTYDLQGGALTFKDQNGTVHSYTFDPVGRELDDAVTTLGSGVDGTVRRLAYSFNDAGLPYQQTSYSASSGGSVVNQEEDIYNGLQQLITQYQSVSGSVSGGTPAIGYNYNVMGDGQNNSKLDSIVYPDGRLLDYDYSPNQEPVTGITVSGTTATVTTAVADGLSTGAKVTIAGASHTALDGTFTITVASSTTFTYTFTGSAAADSSSDLTETPVSLDSVISRPDGLQDQAGSAAGAVLQGYTYLGLGTIVQETNSNNTELTYIQQSPAPTPTPTTIDSGGDRYAGLDRFGRVDFQNWITTSTGARIQGDQYAYDADSNVLYDNIVIPGISAAASWSQLYHASSTTSGDDNSAYDPLNRVTQDIRGTLSASGNNGNFDDTITNANINTNANSDQTYALDALGNWTGSAAGAGTGTSTAPTLTSTSRTNNSQNEDTGVGSATLTFDNNGNTTKDQAGNTFAYDAWDRPIVATLSGGGSITYSYLPGDNVASRAACPGVTVDSYYSTDMQVLEDDVPSSCCGGGGGCCGGGGGSPTVQSQYVWGLDYVNQMVERDDNSSSGSLGISSSGLGRRIYPEQDANFNVRTLTSSSGSILEHINYDSYGNAEVLNSAYGSPSAFGSDTYNWIYGFQGGRYDPSTGLYHFGARYYSPVLGRWMEQDPSGYGDGGDLYQGLRDRPADMTDPSGLQAWYEGWGNMIWTALGGEGGAAAGQVWGGAGQGLDAGSQETGGVLARPLIWAGLISADVAAKEDALTEKKWEAMQMQNSSVRSATKTCAAVGTVATYAAFSLVASDFYVGTNFTFGSLTFANTSFYVWGTLATGSPFAANSIWNYESEASSLVTADASIIGTSCFPAGTLVQMADENDRMAVVTAGPAALPAGPHPSRGWDWRYVESLEVCVIIAGAGYYLLWDHRRLRFLAMAKEMLDAVKAIDLPLHAAPMH